MPCFQIARAASRPGCSCSGAVALHRAMDRPRFRAEVVWSRQTYFGATSQMKRSQESYFMHSCSLYVFREFSLCSLYWFACFRIDKIFNYISNKHFCLMTYDSSVVQIVRTPHSQTPMASASLTSSTWGPERTLRRSIQFVRQLCFNLF